MQLIELTTKKAPSPPSARMRIRSLPGFAPAVAWVFSCLKGARDQDVVRIDLLPVGERERLEREVVHAVRALDDAAVAVARRRAIEAALERIEVILAAASAGEVDRGFVQERTAALVDAVLGLHRSHLIDGEMPTGGRRDS